ncbi:MAG: LamG-like jellyroll fold domain-containing protein, partial [Nitrosotalea sp.]
MQPSPIKQVGLQDLEKNLVPSTRHLSITLSESVGVGSNDHSPSNQQNILQNNKMINLSDQVLISSNDHNRNLILVTPNDSIITTLDRISNPERIRINGKIITVENKITDEQSNKISSFINSKTSSFTEIHNFKNNDLISFILPSKTMLFSYMPTGISSAGFDLLHNTIVEINHFTSPNKDSAVILLFIPITGYILTRFAGNKIQTKSKQILSFCVFGLLISSMVVTPLSISPIFLTNVYAESSDQDNKNIIGTNSSTSPVFSSSNATQLGPVFSSSNATQLGPVFSSSNATQLGPVFSSSNATQLGPVFSSSNATQLGSSIQNVTQSWNFTSLNGKVGHVTASNNTLQLQGTGYLAQKINTTNDIQQLTLSAWVKPDYSQGSPQFTIISKENTFMLTINNNIPPTKIATFSVFDGIKWQTVQSTSVIPEEWTYIAATFDPSSISIYVNGTKESTIPLSGIPSIAINGKIMNKTIDQLSSDADVVIGANLDTTRQTSNSQFSGLIKDVSMYNSVLSESQIRQLYANGQSILGTNLVPAQTNLISTNATSITNTTSTISFTDSNSTNLSEMVYANDMLTALVNATSTNSTDMPIIPSMNTTQQSYLLTENPEFNFQYYSDAVIKKSGKILTSYNGTTQSDGWKSSHESITLKITAPDGKEIMLKNTVKKIRDGKFDITLSSLKSAKPGLYTITAILTKNGKTYTTTDQYMWGLVSVNTQKSIYKPGEVANFIIVVLDNQGHSVCNSNIVMNIHSPASSTKTLSSGNGITPEEQCGLYDAQYVPQSEGNYTVDIVAHNPSGVASFSTSFLVQNSFAFDIVRTAQSKIDPVNNPNSFNVRLDVTSYTNATSVNIQEIVPSIFNVTTDAAVQTVGNTTTLTWNKNLIGNATSVQYSYSVPLEFPRLYALGPAKISYGTNSIFTEARPWFVANDPAHESNAAVSSGNTALFKLYNGPTWTASYSGMNSRVLVVTVALNPGTNGNTVSTILYNPTTCTSNTPTGGQALTKAISTIDTTNKEESEIWYLVNPTTSGNKVCVALTSGSGAPTRWDTDAYTFVNVDSVNPIYATSGGTTFGTSSTGTGAVSLNTQPKNILIDAIAAVGSRAISVGSGQTALYTRTTNNNLRSVASDKATSSPTTDSMSTTWSGGSMNYAYSVIELQGSSISATGSLGFSDIIETSASHTVVLSETITTSDALSTAVSKNTTLTETVTAHDSAGKSVNQSLTDSPIARDALLTSASYSAQVTSILIDNTQTATGTGTSITIPSFTVSSGANRYLLVAIETNGTSVASVTYGAQSLSKIRSSNDLNRINTEIWGVVNPTSGTGDVIVDFSPHTAIAVVGAYNILGVDQTNPIPTTVSGTSGVGGGSPSVFITNQYATSIVIDSAGKQIQTISTTAPQSQTWNLQSGGVTGGSSTILPNISVSNHFIWTPGASIGSWVEAAVEVKASGLISPSEIIHVTDTLTTAASKSITLSETVTVADHTVSLSGGRNATLAETVTASDALSTVGTKSITLDETVTSVDQAGMSGGRSKTFTETVTTSDSLTTAASRNTTLAETVTASDALSTAVAKNATLAETVTASDSVTTAVAKNATLAETVTASDSVTTAVAKNATLAETVTASDALSTAVAKNATLAETVTASDALSTAVAKNATLAETVTASDSVTTAVAKKATLAETVTASDSVTTAVAKKATLAETVTASDALSTA